MRTRVNRQRLLALLTELGRTFPDEATVYLTGSAALVMQDVRESVDIDYSCRVAPELEGRFVAAVRDLKDRMQVSLELISPADFIPLPDGWEARCRFVDRFGKISVYLFDPYSIGLTKLLRGKTADLEDVAHQLRDGTIASDRMQAMISWLASRWSLSGWHREGDPDKLRERLEHGWTRARRIAGA